MLRVLLTVRPPTVELAIAGLWPQDKLFRVQPGAVHETGFFSLIISMNPLVRLQWTQRSQLKPGGRIDTTAVATLGETDGCGTLGESGAAPAAWKWALASVAVCHVWLGGPRCCPASVEGSWILPSHALGRFQI